MKTEKIEKIIKASLDELANITNEENSQKTKQKSKLIFPKYRKDENDPEAIGKVRISEQEARVLFIRELEKAENEFYYSIETPTSKRYNFSDNNKEPKIIQDKKGMRSKSASFDLTIYNSKFEREHFVEFKNENVFTIKKDFLKLLCDEGDKENFLIHLIKRESLGKRNTLKNIIGKYEDAVNYINKEYSITSKLKIILFNINDGEKKWFKEISNQNTKVEVLK